MAKVQVRAHSRRAPSLSKQALRDAQQAEKPVIGAIKSAQSQYDTTEAQREANVQGFSQALAQLLGGAAKTTSDAYQGAAGATASFGKGFSDAEKHIADNENASLKSFLDKAGISGPAADTALSKIGGTGDVLYGTQGYTPASNLEREGAAFTSAASMLPGTAVGLGEQGLAQLRGDRSKQDAAFESQISAERSKIPSLAQSLLNQMLTRAQQEESLRIQEGYLGNSNRAAQISATGVDPVTGATKPGYYQDKSGHVLPDGYVMKNGHPVRVSSSSKKGYDFNGAMSTAQPHIYTAAKGLVTTEKSNDPLAGLAGHPATITHKPPYAKAAKELFNEYKYLLRQVPRSKQPKAKRVLVQTIREALAAVGITPAPASQNVPQPQGPGVGY